MNVHSSEEKQTVRLCTCQPRSQEGVLDVNTPLPQPYLYKNYIIYLLNASDINKLLFVLFPVADVVYVHFVFSF